MADSQKRKAANLADGEAAASAATTVAAELNEVQFGHAFVTIPKQLFYGDVTTGAGRRGGSKGRYKDTLKNTLKRLYTNPETWEDLASSTLAWRRLAQLPTKKIGSPPSKPKGRLASHKYLASSMPTVNRSQHARAANAHPLRAIRPRWASSDAMRQLSDNAYFPSHKHRYYHPRRKPRDDDYSRHQ
ncbi:hypothetical protein SprV_0702359700 [Sparganum proliferum]